MGGVRGKTQVFAMERGERSKDGTQETSTEEVGSVSGKGDGKVWLERQDENQKRLSQKPRDICQSLKCLTQKGQVWREMWVWQWCNWQLERSGVTKSQIAEDQRGERKKWAHGYRMLLNNSYERKEKDRMVVKGELRMKRNNFLQEIVHGMIKHACVFRGGQ